MRQEENFQRGISILRRGHVDAWARSNINFLLGFNARLNGNLPAAEAFLREAYGDSPGNFSAAHELASICVIRGDLDSAEQFAREAYQTAPDNPYILDILLSTLIKLPAQRRRDSESEIEVLFEKLKQVSREDWQSFYEIRRAEYECKMGKMLEACRLIDEAHRKTLGIFDVHGLRAVIYLERGIKTVAFDVIKTMRGIVYQASGRDRLSHLRSLLEVEAAYNAAIGDYDTAKDFYRNDQVFTDKEADDAIKRLEYEQAYRSG